VRERRRDRDDRAVALASEHVRETGSRYEEDAPEVVCERPVERLRRHLVDERPAADRPRARDEHIDSSQRRRGVGHDARGVGLDGQVAGKHGNSRSGRFDRGGRLLERRRSPSADRDARSLGGEAERDSAADPATAASDEDPPAVEASTAHRAG
jgi:hypothetical protein